MKQPETGLGQTMVRSPGRAGGFTSRSAFTSRGGFTSHGGGAKAFTSKQAGTGAPVPSNITLRAAQDLDQQFALHGCTGCDDMGSDLRVKTLAFKAAALLDPATQNNVSLNVSTPLAQSGFGPGTDAALTLVLGATRQSTGHCTDDNGFCTQAGFQTPAVPPELAALANALNAQIGGMISSGQQVSQTDATLAAIVGQIVALFKQFAETLKGVLSTKEQSAPPPVVTAPPAAPPAAMMPAAKPMSGVGMALGVVGIALVALGTGALIVTVTKKKGKARR